ncbi:MAG TPA: ABC transporter permease [Streptosporangiaceae bacterium]|nr:ABC transporter permease [Streptosporangiaceae bacterium]
MGRFLLIGRLVARDLRRRPAQAALLLLVIAAAAATLVLGLVLNGVTSNPYQRTRAATAGPDVVASFLNLAPLPPGGRLATALAAMRALARAPAVTGHAGPYPVAWATLRVHGLKAGAMAEGRDQALAPIDQPKLTQGSWVRGDGVVIERSFADALGIRAGDLITLNDRPFRVSGIAVSAANAPFPHADFAMYGGPFPTAGFGMIWLTRASAQSLATTALPLSYLEDLRLADPARAGAFDSARSTGSMAALGLSSWQDIRQEDNNLVVSEQRALLVGSWLLGLLAIASVAVLVGGRMAEQTRRVGLLKAIGGTPGLVAAVLLAENLILALIAAAVGSRPDGWPRRSSPVQALA